MPYGDEQIIAQRIKRQQQQAHTINGQVTIGGRLYTFSRQEFDLGFSMIVPNEFQPMPIAIAKQKFPHENRPQTILSSDDFRTCLAFHKDNRSPETIEERLNHYRNFMKRLRPTTVFGEKIVVDAVAGLKIGWYDYRYSVIDRDLYNISFFADLPERELLGWFICPQEMQLDWEPLVRQMVESILIEKEGA